MNITIRQKIVFGEHSEQKLESLLKAYNVKSLQLVYSGDFIKTLGIYDVIKKAVAELRMRRFFRAGNGNSVLLERYFSDEKYSDTTDYLIEGAIRALFVNADKLIKNPKDVNARGEIQWLASVAHGGFLDAGRRADWGSHRIEHELSAQYNITHGEGMAVVTVAWTKYMAEKKPWRLALLANRVFGVDASKSWDLPPRSRNLTLETNSLCKIQKIFWTRLD